MTLGEKIQGLRKASGLSQEQLAETIGVSRQSVSKWELDDAQPDLQKVLALSRFFGVTVDGLLNGEEQIQEDRQLENLVQQNRKQEQKSLGIKIMSAGLLLLALTLLSLPFIAAAHKWLTEGWGYYTDFWRYITVQPLPVVIFLSVVLIGLGGFLWFKSKDRDQGRK